MVVKSYRDLRVWQDGFKRVNSSENASTRCAQAFGAA